MVKPFQFARIPRIIFRIGSLGSLPDQIKLFSNIVLVTGESSFINSGHAGRLLEEMARRKISYSLVTIAGEPSPEDIDSAVGSLRGVKPDLVVAVGGGSVLDAGKAIAAMAGMSEPVVRFLEGVGDLEHPGTRLPFIAIPTTSGTGSEATKNAVISRTGPEGFKKSLRHDNFVPDLALVDPELTLSCPPGITAASGMDCFSQLIEAYLSEKSVQYTDALAIEGLKALKDSLVKCYNDGQDTAARAGMSFAALTSGICLANAGLGVVHGFASSLGGLYEIPHGVVCGTLMSGANEITVRELRKRGDGHEALKKYALLGRLFLGENGNSDDYYTDGFIALLKKLTAELKLPDLKKYGVRQDDIFRICSATDNKYNPVKLEPEIMQEIIAARL